MKNIRNNIYKMHACGLLCLIVMSRVIEAATSYPVNNENAAPAISQVCSKKGYSEIVWNKNLTIDSFVKIQQFSGDKNYYTIMSSDSGWSFLHSHYVPDSKVVRYGYQLPDTLTKVTNISWRWRVTQPPQGADERKKGFNDSGCSVYLIFREDVRTYIIKYVYSSTVPEGTIIRKDPMYPVQQMYLVVTHTWNPEVKDQWRQVTVNVNDDFRKLYNKDTCPDLKGIGILSDGDGTKSEVVADYAQFVITGVKK